MDKTSLIKNLCELLVSDKKDDCHTLIETYYPFTEVKIFNRKYSKFQMCKIFLRDGFIDRYTGKELIFPGLIRLLSFEFPDLFKYHPNWKMSETHNMYWEFSPTIDHIVPIARGGLDTEDNWVTTSMLTNSAKSNWTLEELQWSLKPKGNLKEWDGLCDYFIKLTSENKTNNTSISQWKSALIKAKTEVEIEQNKITDF